MYSISLPRCHAAWLGLARCTRGSQPAVSLVAVEAANQLLLHAAGQEAFHDVDLPADVRHLLYPFLDRKPSSDRAADPTSSAAAYPGRARAHSAVAAAKGGGGKEAGTGFLSEAEFMSKKLWVPDVDAGQSYNQWVRLRCSVLYFGWAMRMVGDLESRVHLFEFEHALEQQIAVSFSNIAID
jgi:hypothetical protein